MFVIGNIKRTTVCRESYNLMGICITTKQQDKVIIYLDHRIYIFVIGSIKKQLSAGSQQSYDCLGVCIITTTKQERQSRLDIDNVIKNPNVFKAISRGHL